MELISSIGNGVKDTYIRKVHSKSMYMKCREGGKNDTLWETFM